METNYKEKISYQQAKKRFKEIKGFYIHLLVYLFINAAILIVIAQDQGLEEALTNLSNYSTLFFWGIGLLAHWVGVFGSNLYLTRNWEERKIKEIMKKESEKQTWK